MSLLKERYPLLYKILERWREEPERPPLLLNGLEEAVWTETQEEISNIFFGKNVLPNHPDIIILDRDIKKQNIEVKATRDFINQLALSNYEFSFKLGIIPSAHLLNVQSQNALLKTLEEPLDNRYLILGARSKNQLLPTILSRSTIVNLPKINIAADGQVKELLLDCLKSPMSNRLLKGQNWSEGRTEKISEFFNLLVPELQYLLLESLRDKNVPKIKSLTEQIKKALDYSEQLKSTSGANPKLLFESFLLQLK